MKRGLLILAGLMLIASQASAFGFNYSVFDGWDPLEVGENDVSHYDYPHGVGYQPSPGGNEGEKFDIEGFKAVCDDDYVYIAMSNSYQNGYYQESRYWPGVDYFIGDVFMTTNDGTKLAIDLPQYTGWSSSGGTLDLLSGVSAQGIPVMDGTYGSYPSVAAAAGDYQAIGADNTYSDGVDFYLTNWEDYETDPLGGRGPDDVWVWEFRIDRDLLPTFTSLDMHVAASCGNDWANEDCNDAVPEPATMLLFGLGLAGAAVIRRRR